MATRNTTIDKVAREIFSNTLMEDSPNNTNRTYELSDLGNAERFIDQHGERVRWVPKAKYWLIYDGTRWVWDERGEVVKLAQATARSIHRDAESESDPNRQRAVSRFALSSQNESRINGMLSQAKPHLAILMEELDTDRWVINCRNGTIDLKTRELKAHNPDDLLTKIVPVAYNPESKRTRFEQFLKEVLVEEDVIAFVKRFAGYSATGNTHHERIFAILHGEGMNGKSTLVELLQDALGDYATGTEAQTILTKRYHSINNDIAALKGARFVSVRETEKDEWLAESKVKELTGNDTITARFLFCEPFDFRPEFTLWISTNNKPGVRGTDNAIWDRIRLIPFNQRFEGKVKDIELPQKLREELEGVFAWIVEGCLEWQQHGLEAPKTVTEATAGYRAEMDTLAAFISDCCVVHENASVPATPLYNKYVAWCEENHETRMNQRSFGQELKRRGYRNETLTSGPYKARKGWFGIGLRVDDSDPDPSNGRRSKSDKDTTNPSQSDIKKQTMPNQGQPGRPLDDYGQPAKSGLDKPNTHNGVEEVDDSRPKIQESRPIQPREERNSAERSTKVNRPTLSTNGTGLERCKHDVKDGCWLCRREIDKLIGEGMMRELAREAVLNGGRKK